MEGSMRLRPFNTIAVCSLLIALGISLARWPRVDCQRTSASTMAVKFRGPKALSYSDLFQRQCKRTSRTMRACPQATYLLLRRSSLSNLLRRLQQHRHDNQPAWSWQNLNPGNL